MSTAHLIRRPRQSLTSPHVPDAHPLVQQTTDGQPPAVGRPSHDVRIARRVERNRSHSFDLHRCLPWLDALSRSRPFDLDPPVPQSRQRVPDDKDHKQSSRRHGPPKEINPVAPKCLGEYPPLGRLHARNLSRGVGAVNVKCLIRVDVPPGGSSCSW